ncbi:transcriptional regulator domain-containing protein [Tistrella mobilis]|uniref:transcriptional regulator domain-containing protein n=1 Tax=Tistrella mobilis TaxID=171437 RepID=UPI00355793D7
MPRDWREDRHYDHFDTLGLSGLAWECLRRNEDYCAAWRRADRDTRVADWGLRFPGRSGARRARNAGILEPRRRARCRSPDRADPDRPAERFAGSDRAARADAQRSWTHVGAAG